MTTSQEMAARKHEAEAELVVVFERGAKKFSYAPTPDVCMPRTPTADVCVRACLMLLANAISADSCMCVCRNALSIH